MAPEGPHFSIAAVLFILLNDGKAFRCKKCFHQAAVFTENGYAVPLRHPAAQNFVCAAVCNKLAAAAVVASGVSAGSSLLLQPRTRYHGEHDPEHPLLVIYVHFQFCDLYGNGYVPDGIRFTNRNLCDPSYMTDLLRRVVRLYNADRTEMAETVFRAELVEYLTQDLPTGRAAYGADKPALMQAVCDRINTNPAKPPALASLAAEYGYSPDYFGRVFTAVVGISFSEYVAHTRIGQAKFLLCSTAMTVEQIAETLGYYDSCHFIRQFGEIVGISPGKYRSGHEGIGSGIRNSSGNRLPRQSQ